MPAMAHGNEERQAAAIAEVCRDTTHARLPGQERFQG
jgi:hypothetical protein